MMQRIVLDLRPEEKSPGICQVCVHESFFLLTVSRMLYTCSFTCICTACAVVHHYTTY